MFMRFVRALTALCALAPLASVASVSAYASEDLYQKQDTWAATMSATKAACLAAREAGSEAPVLQPGPWYATGPLEAPDQAFAHLHVDIAAPDFASEANRDMWRRVDYVDGRVHSLPAANHASTYLAREIRVDRAARVQAWFGSDDGMEAWLNGERLLSVDVPRGAGARQNSATLELREGANTLVLKIFNRTGDHGFYFSLGDNPLAVLADLVARDFPAQTRWMRRDLGMDLTAWFETGDSVALEAEMVRSVVDRLGRADMAAALAGVSLDGADSAPRLAFYEKAARALAEREAAREQIRSMNLVALGRAIRHLSETYPDTYPSRYLEQLEGYEQVLEDSSKALEQAGDDLAAELYAFQREALLANPLLDFDRLLLVKRRANRMGLPQNWQGNCSIAATGYDNEIALLDYRDITQEPATLYRPEESYFVGNLYLHYDGDRMLFSMPGSHNRWQIWEIGADGTGLRQVTQGQYPDVDHYDACYLPDGRIIMGSTGVFHGVPCVAGGDAVANLYIINEDGSGMRQLCFDQDHNWCPTVLNNGRVLFTRWEYSDTAHYFTRLLFHMNPDGTNQSEYYGSNSYWPNSMFYTRPIPGHPTQVVTIVSGHHGVARMGELLILDPAKGRHEADGVVQRIPGYGQTVEPVIVDELVNNSWPKFLHPHPLSGEYFLVASQPTAQSLWGIYLVDRFDNMLLLKEIPEYALLEPIPLRATEKPPIIPDRVDLSNDMATVYLTDVYEGDGLKNVPRGQVDRLRIYEFHYAYNNMGGHEHVAVEGAWDVRRMLGTVPVLEDGSAVFTVPANMPLAVQPIDKEGRALQVMRSWFTAMPGETLSCVGCHERQNQAPPPRMTLAARQAPMEVEEWNGPHRGFSFTREVQQPVLERYCVGCHNGETAEAQGVPDFSNPDRRSWANFTAPYLALHPYVRRPGPESDYHMEVPMEYHTSTSELVQMLQKGHHNVQLDEEAWDRLYTWIDLNVPDHGTWGEHQRIPSNFHQRRLEMRTRYANRPEDPEFIPEIDLGDIAFIAPEPAPAPDPAAVECPGWPFDADQAVAMQQAGGTETRRSIELGDGVTLEMAYIPSGEFVMGSNDHTPDEWPMSRARIDQPFWMGVTAVTHAQFRQFDPSHDNRFINQFTKDHTTPGYSIQDPDMPVVRISWRQAMDFCEWLSAQTGLKVTLPTEAQWEWACRAGSADPFHFGDLDADFSTWANLADLSTRRLAVSGVNPQPIRNPNDFQAWVPRDNRFDDGARIMNTVAQYGANAWGLHDMHGNAWEWTRSQFAPYPYRDDDGRNDVATEGMRSVRGGSWMDRPHRATAAYRWRYPEWQKVNNVGFRVVVEMGDDPVVIARAGRE